MMDDSKRAAKAFVDQYFPVKEPNPKSSDVLGDLFPPNSKKESPKKLGTFGGQSMNAQSAVADSKFQGCSAQKSQNTPQMGSNTAEHCEISDPCLMSSSVDYGCRDNYPYNPDNRYPGPSYYIEKKERKDGSEYANPEIGGGAEWWQGNIYQLISEKFYHTYVDNHWYNFFCQDRTITEDVVNTKCNLLDRNKVPLEVAEDGWLLCSEPTSGRERGLCSRSISSMQSVVLFFPKSFFSI